MIRPRHRYTQVNTRLRWKALLHLLLLTMGFQILPRRMIVFSETFSVWGVFLGGFEVKVWNFCKNRREMVIWSNGATLSHRIPKHRTYISLVRFCMFVFWFMSSGPGKSERNKRMKKQFFALHKCRAIMFPKKTIHNIPVLHMGHDDKLKSPELDLKNRRICNSTR